jgi:superfamily II DNA or RNA helicase
VEKLTLRKSGAVLEISLDGKPHASSALPEAARRILEPALQYQYRKFLYGADRRCPVTGVQRRVLVTDKQLYRYDEYGRLITNFGFANRVQNLLRSVGYILECKIVPSDREAHRDCARPDAYSFCPENILEHFQFRERQDDAIAAIAGAQNGLVNAVTGFGKLVLIAMTCLAYPKAVFHIVTRRATLVHKIHDYLTKYIPDVGLVGAGSRYVGRRVTVSTAASMHHLSPWDADFLLADEAHELLAEESAKFLAKYDCARMFAFTASPTGRMDGTDMRMEAIFGEQIFYLPYWEAVELGLVVPIRVEWTDVLMDHNPVADKDGVPKKRWGHWRNQYRNQLIADKANSFDSADQVLLLVDTIEHACYLKAHLPTYKLVYAPGEVAKTDFYVAKDLVKEEDLKLTPKLAEQFRKEFEAGELKKVIATGVWSVGIDPVHLTALIRGSAGSSEIMDIQAPGRASRRVPGKHVGIVCDFKDQFDSAFSSAAKKRASHYKALRWEQV